MNQKLDQLISELLSISISQVASVLELLDSGATIPFIARYRKEKTGSLDEVQIENIRNQAERITTLHDRRNFILKVIKEQEKLTSDLEKKIYACKTLSALEDLYLPYKPKRRTKATIAKEQGLEPLADQIWEGKTTDPTSSSADFLTDDAINTTDDALQGARYIIAERLNEQSDLRNSLRILFNREATITSKVITGKETEGEKFRDYFEWSEKLKDIPSHRLLALRRGEKELILRLDISPEADDAISQMSRFFPSLNSACLEQVEEAAKDAYKRLLQPSLETEFRVNSKLGADETAIEVFSTNLKELLMASPLGSKKILAIDPGFRTGCKVVCLDQQGNLKENATIYPHEPQKQGYQSEETLKALVKKYDIEAIAFGNGTASRETEKFLQGISDFKNIPIISVNESGASIYSASEVAREEFPDQDITVRGSVSIGRRLADPLAELVKIDAKSIGVGQYQHDVDQNLLKKSLDSVVTSCVNNVGVELNTASKQLLTYVSGLNKTLAQNIIDYRKENGAFKSRTELKKVARMGAKAFEQCAGFLRIRGAKNPLDTSSVHPERYALVKQMAADNGCSINDLITNSVLRKGIDIKKYVSTEVGLPTLKDIVQELDKPGRDPRESFEVFSFAEGVNEISDLHTGMTLPGIVTNVTNFGAFVDVGVHQDGLVHISQLANRFVSDPNEVVKVNQKVTVRVLEVDVNRKRLSFSMKDEQQQTRAPKSKTQQKPKKQNQSKSNSDLSDLKKLWNN